MCAGKCVLIICLTITVVVFFNCSGPGNQQQQTKKPDIDEFLGEAFKAIKNRDWGRYSKLTITSADFVLKKMGISTFKEKQSYVGSSVKPAEIKKQYAQFQQAVTVNEANEEDMIYFDRDTFVSMGKIADQGIMPALNNTRIPYKVYTVKVKSDSGAVMDDLYPYFVIVQWGSSPRILKLTFPEAPQ